MLPTIPIQNSLVLSPPTEDGYEPVEGRDLASIELERQIEARAAAKTASDYAHIVWAYGILWAAMALYVLRLHRKAKRLAGEIAELAGRIPSP